MNANKQICRCFEAFLLLTAVAFVLTPGCSDEKSPRARGDQRKNAWTKGTPAKDFKIDNQEEVLLQGSIKRLQRIAGGMRLANHLNGQFPAKLHDREVLTMPEDLLSPTDLVANTPALPLGFGAWPLDRQWQWAFDNCSYEYLPGQKEADGANILLYESPKPNKKKLPVYFMDGKVKLATATQLTDLLQKQKATGKLADADRKPLADEPPSIK